MQTSTVAIVLLAALAHALWNLASKYKRGDTLLFVCVYTCASAMLYVPISLVLEADLHDALDWRLAAAAAVSALLHNAYSLILQAGYDRAELGVVYPIARGTGPVITMTIAILLGERITAVAIAGALLIVAGIVVVTGNPFGRGKNRVSPHAIRWGVATGFTIACYTLWDSYCVSSLHLAPLRYYAATLLLQCFILAPSVFRQRKQIPAVIRTNPVPVLVVAVFSPLAYILVLTAMQSAPVALVAPLRESSIVVGSLVGCWLFREGYLVRKVTGAMIVLIGIAAISLQAS